MVLVLPRFLPLSGLDLQEAKGIDPQIIGNVWPPTARRIVLTRKFL